MNRARQNDVVFQRLEAQMRAGFEVLEWVRAKKDAGRIKGFAIRVLSADPFVIESVSINH